MASPAKSGAMQGYERWLFWNSTWRSTDSRVRLNMLTRDGPGRPSSMNQELLAVEALFDCNFAVLLHVDDAMHALESR
jgi:hypothetical protein